jgi:rubrerythrin
VTSRSDKRDHTSLSFIERLIVREKGAVEAHQNRAASVEDRDLKSLFKKLAEIHAQGLAELQLYLSEVKSRDEITEEINEIYL